MNNETQKIIEILNDGGVVALPTDTVYGLIALYGNTNGYDKIFEIKNRPSDKKLILFIDKIDRLNEFCDNIDEKMRKYLDSIWPGPTTVILNCKNNESLGFRIPRNDLILDIIKQVDSPLYSTSANTSGKKYVKEFKDLEMDILENIDYYIEGICEGGKPSTIIDLRDNEKKILRD